MLVRNGIFSVYSVSLGAEEVLFEFFLAFLKHNYSSSIMYHCLNKCSYGGWTLHLGQDDPATMGHLPKKSEGEPVRPLNEGEPVQGAGQGEPVCHRFTLASPLHLLVRGRIAHEARDFFCLLDLEVESQSYYQPTMMCHH